MNTPTTFTWIFLVALAATTLFRLWLARRHIAHILLHREQVPAEFSAAIPPETHQKAADYSIAKTRIGMINTLAGAVILLLFTLAGGLDVLHGFWIRWFEPASYLYGIALIGSVMAISGILDLPFDLYRTFVIEARFGFNKTTLKLFVTDLVKQTFLGIALGLPLLFVVLWLMGAMGANWWLYVWLVWMGFSLLMLAAYPTFIAPLFNKFSPLQDDALKSRIEALLARCGFRSSGLFIMDSSKRSSHGNAYFSGFGAAKRIVLFDTLVSRLTPVEIEAVLAHELGHFRHRHVWKRIAELFATSLGFLWLLGQLANQPWFFESLGIHTAPPNTAMALLLFFMIVPVFTFLFQPFMSRTSRKHEFEADAYAAKHANAADLISALVKLYRDNASTLTPDPLAFNIL